MTCRHAWGLRGDIGESVALDMRNWDSGSGTCGTGTAVLGQALQGQFDCFLIFL